MNTSEKSYLSAGEDVDESDVMRMALNGFGRIGRNIFRVVLDNPRTELVAINDIVDFDDVTYLTKYDSVMGRLDGIERGGDSLSIGGTSASSYNIQFPAELPWDELDVDMVLECTDIFRTKEGVSAHLEAGADKVVISAPPKGDEPVRQIVYGINHDEYDDEDTVSDTSCTINSVTLIARVLDKESDIENDLLTTVRTYTGSQNLIDNPYTEQHRGRTAAESIVPTTTGAAQTATGILPQLDDKLNGIAARVPVSSGSLTELVVRLEDRPSVEEINDTFCAAAGSDLLAGIFGYTDNKVTSRDILGLPFPSTVGLNTTNRVNDDGFYKILTWYNNEYGFSNRVLDVTHFITYQ